MFTVPGRLSDGTPVVTTIRHGRQQRVATIQLGDAAVFTVSVRGRHIDDLVEALREGDSLGVPCRHPHYGDWLLGVHPHQWWVNPRAERLPMELYLLLPADQQIVVVFTPEQVDELASLAADRELLGADQCR
ncbi:hypothetical protein [Kutzneria sp. CA-103260]|uniref:hypothetical protein n=1 Tax=Kutzneria sp. CA-103260 TaxID=2802641 RepID=UPI001BA577E4|nr:hypothetical protein [Kutzneria sp. CA-103260]QUQ62661.1 hypothetical protein JJ691_03730 [Kutzneria sp. CA-103260]